MVYVTYICTFSDITQTAGVVPLKDIEGVFDILVIRCIFCWIEVSSDVCGAIYLFAAMQCAVLYKSLITLGFIYTVEPHMSNVIRSKNLVDN